MNGLMGGAGTAPTGFRPGEGDDDQEPNVTEEEQAQYERFVGNGMEVLYGGEDGPVRKEIIGRLSQGQDRMESLAQTAVWLTMLIENSAEQNGVQLDDAVVLHGGKAMFEELVNIAEAAKLHDFKQQEMQGAWYRALDMYREANTKSEENPGGRVDAEALKAQFGELDAADRIGQAKELIGMDPARAAQEAEVLGAMERGDEEEETLQ